MKKRTLMKVLMWPLKLLKRLLVFLTLPIRWLWKMTFVRSYEHLRVKLDGSKILKEDLRKLGHVLMGLGCAGPLINGKLEALPLLFVGLLLWLIGLLPDTPKENKDV